MRWEDEIWVKLYTNDYPEWLAMSWQARGLFALLMRAVDKAGILSVGGKLGIKGVAVKLRAPWAEIEPFMRELLDDGCVDYDEAAGKLLIPNFIEAQTATMSDVGRKRKSREEARAGVKRSRSVTPGHKVEQNVTDGHKNGEVVTEGHENSGSLLSSTQISSHVISVGVQGGKSDTPPLQLVRPEPTPTKQRKGHRLPEDWEPKSEMVTEFAARGFDALASLKRFKNHWLAATGKTATKMDWDRTFENWVDSDIEKGVAKKTVTNGTNGHTNGTTGKTGYMMNQGKMYDRATRQEVDPVTKEPIVPVATKESAP